MRLFAPRCLTVESQQSEVNRLLSYCRDFVGFNRFLVTMHVIIIVLPHCDRELADLLDLLQFLKEVKWLPYTRDKDLEEVFIYTVITYLQVSATQIIVTERLFSGNHSVSRGTLLPKGFLALRKFGVTNRPVSSTCYRQSRPPYRSFASSPLYCYMDHERLNLREAALSRKFNTLLLVSLLLPCYCMYLLIRSRIRRLLTSAPDQWSRF